MLRLFLVRLVVPALCAAWATPALAEQAGEAATPTSATALLILGAIATLVLPMSPPERFVTRAVAPTKVSRILRDVRLPGRGRR